MEVVIDTNVIINAVFDQPHNDDCWQILHFVFQQKITPVLCIELCREYTTTPQKLVLTEIAEMLTKKQLTAEIVETAHERLVDYSIKLTKLLRYAKWYDIQKCYGISVLHAADNKLIDLAINAKCSYIISDNFRHLDIVNVKEIRIKNEQTLKLYSPDDFLDYYKLKEWEMKSKASR